MTRHVTRRTFVALFASCLFALAASPSAWAQTSADNAFVRQFADQLVAIINGPDSAAARKAALGPVIDHDVDVDRIARFCLGRFWTSATPAQQAQYTTVFHQVLLNAISGHLGEYKGVSYVMTGDSPQGANTLVGTRITRPNAATVDLQWVVETTPAGPKVVDVIAEGTSMRLTSRSDYASFLTRHGNDVGALIGALQNQVAQGS